MPPSNMTVSQLVRDTGISDATLQTWRKKALSQGILCQATEKIQTSGHLKTSWPSSLKQRH